MGTVLVFTWRPTRIPVSLPHIGGPSDDKRVLAEGSVIRVDDLIEHLLFSGESRITDKRFGNKDNPLIGSHLGFHAVHIVQCALNRNAVSVKSHPIIAV